MSKPTLRRGSFGQDVAAWQRAIGITADGIFGHQTDLATRKWQADHNLEPDGVVGPITWASVSKASTIPAPSERRPERLLETLRTPLTMSDFWNAIVDAWPEATRTRAGILWAHFAGETGDGLSCWNFNLGNMKHVAGDG